MSELQTNTTSTLLRLAPAWISIYYLSATFSLNLWYVGYLHSPVWFVDFNPLDYRINHYVDTLLITLFTFVTCTVLLKITKGRGKALIVGVTSVLNISAVASNTYYASTQTSISLVDYLLFKEDLLDTILLLLRSHFTTYSIALVLILLSVATHFWVSKILKRVNTFILIIFLPIAGWVFFNSTEILRVYEGYMNINGRVYEHYNGYFMRSVDSAAVRSENLVQEPSNSSLPREHIFFIQLESLNGQLVSPDTTPGLLKIAERGALVKNYQAATVNTSLNQEVFLCGTLPSIAKPLVKKIDTDSKLKCLPHILKQLGYKTFYFQGYGLGFAEVGKLMRSAGFDEVHGIEFFSEDAPRLPWGIRDDAVLQEVFDYVSRYENDKLFVHIELSSTNHYPFDHYSKFIPDKYLTRLPIVGPKSLREYVSNSTYVQDQIMYDYLTRLYLPRFADSSHFYIFGDHSWPVGLYRENKYLWLNAWQENFVTALVYLPPATRRDFPKGTVSNHIVSNIDLKDTVLETIGTPLQVYATKSFYSVLLDEKQTERCVLSVQPFSDKYISAIFFPNKYLINLRKNSLHKYNLISDPWELLPIDSDLTPIEVIDKCVSSLGGSY